MDPEPTSVPIDRTDMPVPMDMVQEGEETASETPEVTVIRRMAFEPLSGTPTTGTTMARLTSENSQPGLTGLFSQ